jgi:hypothetical protein
MMIRLQSVCARWRAASPRILQRFSTSAAATPQSAAAIPRLSGLSTHPRSEIIRRLLLSTPHVDIRPSPGKGLGLFAMKAFDAGEILWEEAPTILAPLTNVAEQDHWPQGVFCAHCLGALQPPVIENTSRTSDQHNSDELWQAFRQSMNVLVPWGLRADRAPYLPATGCWSRTPAAKGFDPKAQCEEKYCSVECMEAARPVHEQEHLSEAQQQRFTPEYFDTVFANDALPPIVDLLVKTLATLRSSVAPVDENQLTVLDRLSLLVSPTGLEVISPEELSMLETTFGSFAREALELHPEIRVDDLPGSSSLLPEHRLLRALLYALQVNSFEYHRHRSKVLVTPVPGRPYEVDTVCEALPEEVFAYAMTFPIASFMNHACGGAGNMAIVLPPPNISGPVGKVTFGASKPIRAQEELLLTYKHDVSELPARFGFVCRCPQCAAPR